MYQVITTNGGQVTVAANHGDAQLGLMHGDADGKGNRPTVGRMVRVYIDIACGPAAAANTTNTNMLVQRHPAVCHGINIAVDNRAYAASWTKDMGKPVGAEQTVIGMRACDNGSRSGHGMASRIWAGVGMAPPG